MESFAGKVAIITGGSAGGMGAEIAVAFAKRGAKVVITGRSEDRMQKTKKECEEAGAEVLLLVGDLSNVETLEKITTKTVERFGGIDFLINNAGINVPSPFADVKLEQYESIFQTNVRAPLLLSIHALPHLKKSKGCIINNSSSATTAIKSGAGVYGMSKAALDYLTKALARECAPFGVRVNCINPGGVDTMMKYKVGLSAEQADRIMDEIVKKSQPLGKVTKKQIADAAMFLCSSPTITGVCLLVDGGFGLHCDGSKTSGE